MTSIARAVLVLFVAVSTVWGQEPEAPAKKLPLMVPHTKFSQDCGQCHLPERWDAIRSDFRFDHKKETEFALLGAHAKVKCVQCHNDRRPVAAYESRGCQACHADPHRAGLGNDCRRCHVETTWRPLGMIAEHAKTAFPLTGSHLAADCQKCHTRANVYEYTGASSLCYPCHTAEYQRAPNHIAVNYPTTCESCHNTSTFSTARFNHSFLGNIADCYRCHQADYQRAPNHTTFSFPTTCADCHSTTSFTPARFNHGFLGATPNCYGCHAADYQRAPDHVGQKPTTCYDCHGTTNWDDD